MLKNAGKKVFLADYAGIAGINAPQDPIPDMEAVFAKGERDSGMFYCPSDFLRPN